MSAERNDAWSAGTSGVPLTHRGSALEMLQKHVGGCREELGAPTWEKCWQPAEYVLWGKLIPPEGLGPRCYEHALRHVGHHAVYPRANYALINLKDLAAEIEQQASLLSETA